MLPSPTLATIQNKMRAAICRRCPNAPRGSKSLGSGVPRACEPDCQLFRQLPRLKRAAELLDPTLRSRRVELEHLISQIIAEERRGALGRGVAGAKSPLKRFGKRIAATVDSLYAW